ncbi:MAG: hypothetical protein Q8P81_00190 [Nanoarchaeota archaeon]|nr:hypothetical protein [Nanoarchaeota archaeon]
MEIKPWIEVYPLEGRIVELENSGTSVQIPSDLSDYCRESWKPRLSRGWTDSWIVFVKSMLFQKDKMIMSAESGPFHLSHGIKNSIKEGASFAPARGHDLSLSVGFLTCTEDDKIILQRRSQEVHCPNVFVHEPSGYITSMAFAPREECDLKQYSTDPRLFNIENQLEFRKREIAQKFEIELGEVHYNSGQEVLSVGWQTLDMCLTSTGKISRTSNELEKVSTKDTLFVPFEELKKLIQDQGKLSRDYRKCCWADGSREIPLIDDGLSALIWSYQRLTGDELDIEETLEMLKREGIDIKAHNTLSGTEYMFS